MHIILLLLKIIGIVLLVIVGVFFAVLLAVLFIPVRYEAKGSYAGKKPSIEANISYAFVLLRLRFLYGEQKVGYLRVLGIKCKDFFALPKEKPAKQKRKKKIKKKSVTSEPKKYNEKENAGESSQDNRPGLQADGEDTTGQPFETESLDKSGKKSLGERIASFFEKQKDLIEALKKKASSFADKWKKAKDKAEEQKALLIEYLSFFQSEEMKRAFQKAKRILLRLLKGIRPKKGRLFIRIGTNDPATTGQICGFYGMLYPFIGKCVIIEPDFEHVILESDFYMKGRIYGVSLVKAAVLFLFHKDLKCLRDIIKK